jgi:hypothetical protein
MFEDYVGQLQMATIATITIENEGREMSQKEVRAKLEPIQQVSSSSFAPLLSKHIHTCPDSVGQFRTIILSSCLELYAFGTKKNHD